MVAKLIEWALDNRFIVLVMTGALIVVGVFSFKEINVEAYPDPAPAIIEVVAQWPGASAEEMERLVTIPLEVTLAGMPGLKVTYSKSLFGLTHLRNVFHYGTPYKDARQEVLNRLGNLNQPLPNGVAPQISPASPIGEIYRYTLKSPTNVFKNEIYTLNDLKALQDWLIEREFKRVPGIIDVTSFGGTVKRYEIQPDPERLKRYGITLAQLQNALSNSNANVGGDFLVQGRTVKAIRIIGVLGGGKDPMEVAFGMNSPEEAAAYLREEEQKRLQEIRDIVIVSINGGPIKIDDIVVGGHLPYRNAPSEEGVVVSFQTRLGMVSQDRATDPYRITDKSLVMLRAQHVPEAVLAKLEAIKDKDFDSKEELQKELAKVLSKEELEHYENQIVIHSVGIRYMLTDSSLAAVHSAEMPEKVWDKLVALKDLGFKTRESFEHKLAAIPGLDLPLHDAVLDQARVFLRRQDEKVQGVVLMRKGEKSLPTIEGVKAKVKELNQPGRLLPGVFLETYYDREDLVHLTTETVTHNLVVGIILVTVILMMFLSNIRTAVIVALNIPIALLIAFSVLYMRGESANLLSIGAVDFGIIVDSAVIMAENIYRNLTSGVHGELSTKERILLATREVDRALFFSTAIMVCAFIPLFTMTGAEGQLFGPMSQTYAFALGGALIMALTLTPVLCTFFLQNVKPVPENFMVRFLKNRYLWQLRVCLNHPYVTVVVMVVIMAITCFWALPRVGREFMPELEEGSLWVRGIFPVHISLDAVKDPVEVTRDIMTSSRYPEVLAVVAQLGRPDDGTDPGLFNNAELFVPLRPERDWPVVQRPDSIIHLPDGGKRRIKGEKKKRTRREIVSDMSAELANKLPGIEWAFSQYIRDNVMEAISGVKGDNCVKIYGPDLEELERLAEKTKVEMSKIHGLHDLGIYRIMGQSNLEFAVDKQKCKRFGVQVADVNNVINNAVHGNALTQIVEGPKLFDGTLRWPVARRQDQSSILDIPVDIINNQLTATLAATTQQTTVVGAGQGPSGSGTSNPNPSFVSPNLSAFTSNLPSRLRLKDLVSPVGPDGRCKEEFPEIVLSKLRTLKNKEFDSRDLFLKELALVLTTDELSSHKDELSLFATTGTKYKLTDESFAALRTPDDNFSRPGGSIITREQGKRFIAVKFGVREDMDLASAVEKVKESTAHIYPPGYSSTMGGEFEQMEDGERRLLLYIPASLLLIFILLYIAFHSLMDAVVILSNVFDLAVGGIWALYLTNTNFSMSAAVGFVSLFGVAIMDGLLMISYFNDLRHKGMPCDDAIMHGAALRVRPVTMTCLTAILGLLPAAFSTAIGAQTQRPLAIVVVGGMMTTLFLTRYLMPVLYSFYGHREPPKGASSMAH